MEQSSESLAVLSLLVALLAVIVGPFVSWIVSKHQNKTAVMLAKKQIIAPIRQAWIDRLRGLLSEYLTICFSYYTTSEYIHDLSMDSEIDHEKIAQHVEQRLSLLRSEVELLLNPYEDEHEALLKLMGDCFRGLFKSGADSEFVGFIDNHQKLTAQSKKVLKLEWNRVKDEL